MANVEMAIDAKAILGEGPSWDNENGVLYWVDIEGEKLNVYDPSTDESRSIELGQYVTSVVPAGIGKVAITLKSGYYLLNLETESLTLLKELEADKTENRFNDGKCDAKGRFWAGSMDMTQNNKQGSLYCLNNHQNAELKLSGLGISNGLAWSPDNRYFYFIDTPTKKVVRYDFELVTGQISNPIEVIDFSGEQGMPDGMTIDSEGMLWIAHWNGAQVSRWNPESGERLLQVPVPALNVTSCVFGGEDFTTLYITTARSGMDSEQLQKYPDAGGVFRLETGIKGSLSHPYRF